MENQETLELLRDIQARLLIIMKHLKIKNVLSISEADLELEQFNIENATKVFAERGNYES